MPLPINDDLAKLALQEQSLVLPHFDCDVAWRIGTTLRDLALQRKLAVAIDVRRFGQSLFYARWKAALRTIPNGFGERAVSSPTFFAARMQ